MSTVANRTLVTGFLAFEGFDVNPSAMLAQSCGRPFELLEVSYAAVDAFIDALDASRFDRLLLIGVAGRSSRMRIETTARNIIGARADVRGGAQQPRRIETGTLDARSGTLWTSPDFATESPHCRPSNDAGDYLCNYIYYRALRRFDSTGKRVGFLHVPPLDQMPLERQQAELGRILELIERSDHAV